MNKFRFTLTALAIMAFTLMVSSSAQAQASRTWVSGVGDDVNPCSRTAPCKTFAGAISKTATNGEISVLDPGGFGAVTITKSITINGTHGAGYGSILATLGSSGVIINSATAVVRLKSLDILGFSSGNNGVRIVAAAKVHIQDCHIHGFADRGINDIRTTANGHLYIEDTTVRNNTQSGIVVLPGVGGSVIALLDNVRSEGSSNNSGVSFDGNVKATIRNSFLVGNAVHGLFAGGNGAEVMVENCLISHNITTGINAASPAIVRLSSSTLTNNGASINAGGTSQVSSTGTNTITGNTANNQPAGPPIGQT